MPNKLSETATLHLRYKEKSKATQVDTVNLVFRVLSFKKALSSYTRYITQ